MVLVRRLARTCHCCARHLPCPGCRLHLGAWYPYQPHEPAATIFALLLEKAGLAQIRFHDLRHTCATLLLGRGVHPKFVQELRGHVTIMDIPVQPGDPEARYVTTDLPGCPNGGLLSGTDKSDKLAGEDGEDEVRGLGAADTLSGGVGSDVLYGGPGDDELQGGAGLPGAEPFYDTSKNALHGGPGRDWLSGAEGDDVLYGGEGDDVNLWGGGGQDVLYGGGGNDLLDDSDDGHRDKLYCGEGKDDYFADKIDYVDSSCEVKR